MQNKKLIRFVESFVLLPVTLSMSIGDVPKDYTNENTTKSTKIVSLQKENTGLLGLFSFNQEADREAKILKLKADAIDNYFEEHDMPLAGTGRKMVQEAEKNGLDWRLVAAIAVRESTGGINDCIKVDNNPFGWGSCRIGFKTLNDAIETVARNLGGNNPDTAHHYSGKNTKQILQKYNPPSVVPRYAEQVLSIMKDIGTEKIALPEDNQTDNT